MIRFVLSALVALVLVAPVSAQTVILSADIAELEASQGHSPITLQRVDDDGDGIADSWLLRASLFAVIDYVDYSENVEVVRYALARTTNGVCVEDWFSPVFLAGTSDNAAISIEKYGRRDVIQVQDGTILKAFALDRSRCQ